MKKLRIGLVMQGGLGWAGGTEYVKNLIFAIGQLPESERADIDLHLITGSPLDAKLAEQVAPYVTKVHELSKALPPRTIPNRLRWFVTDHITKQPNARFGEFVTAEGFDFLYPFTYDNYYNIQVRLPIGDAFGACRWAGWIPDFQHRALPEFFDSREVSKRDAGIEILSQDAKTIVFSSQHAADDFKTYHPESKVRAEKLHFYTYPMESWFQGTPSAVRAQFHLPERYLMVCNQFWAHKNHMFLFDALGVLKKRGVEPIIVCTGHPTDFRNRDYFNQLLRRLNEAGVAEQVRILGLIARAEQMTLLRGSMGVVQPSLFEGWSTVVEDARSLGKPILMSDLPVHIEQAPPGGVYFDQKSVEDLANKLAEVWERWKPGPDAAAEAEARRRGVEAAQGYARRFLEIARTAQ